MFALFEVFLKLQSCLLSYEAAVFAEDAGEKPAAGLLSIVIEGLQAEVFQMVCYETCALVVRLLRIGGPSGGVVPLF